MRSRRRSSTRSAGSTPGPRCVVDATASAVRPAHDDAEILAAAMAAERMGEPLVVTRSKDKWTIRASTVRGWIRFERVPGAPITPTIDPAAVAKALAPIAKDVDKKPVSASFLLTRSGKVIGAKAGKNGRLLDKDATAAAIVAEITARGNGTPPQRVPVAVTVVAPKLTTEEATQGRAPDGPARHRGRRGSRSASATTSGANIWLPARFINGTVLEPGQRFEWWRAIGPVTGREGSGSAGSSPATTRSRRAPSAAGCARARRRCSTPRSGPACRWARAHNHTLLHQPLSARPRRDRLEEGGSSQTMTFTNDMDHPILIRGFKVRSGGRGWVRYEIWGIPDGRQGEHRRAGRFERPQGDDEDVYVTTLRPGERKQTEYPSNGMDVSVTRVVRDRNGRIIHRETYALALPALGRPHRGRGASARSGLGPGRSGDAPARRGDPDDDGVLPSNHANVHRYASTLSWYFAT